MNRTERIKTIIEEVKPLLLEKLYEEFDKETVDIEMFNYCGGGDDYFTTYLEPELDALSDDILESIDTEWLAFYHYEIIAVAIEERRKLIEKMTRECEQCACEEDLPWRKA